MPTDRRLLVLGLILSVFAAIGFAGFLRNDCPPCDESVCGAPRLGCTGGVPPLPFFCRPCEGEASGCTPVCMPPCAAPETCGGGGVFEACGCTPDCEGRCAGDDGCGGTCAATCAAPETCGGGMLPDVCGCTSAVGCEVGACDEIDDGCGGTLTCVDCGEPQACNQTGHYVLALSCTCGSCPNACENSCTCWSYADCGTVPAQHNCLGGGVVRTCPGLQDSPNLNNFTVTGSPVGGAVSNDCACAP